MGWVIAIAVLALLAASPLFGADSRDDEGWKPLAGGVRDRPAPPRPALLVVRRGLRLSAGPPPGWGSVAPPSAVCRPGQSSRPAPPSSPLAGPLTSAGTSP